MSDSNEKKTRSKIIKARMSEEEYRKFTQKKEASGLSESEFLRRVVMGVELSGNNAKNQEAMTHICQIHTLLDEARLKMDNVIFDELQGEVSDLCRCLL